jgi:ferric-dicitrate binding protein FerR (iron transport regulator)
MDDETHADAPELGDKERAALAQWSAPEPPAGFAQRVVANLQPAPAASPAPTRSPLRVPAIVAAAASVAAIAVALLRGVGAPVKSAASTGMVAAPQRRSVDLGSRAVAVIEPGGELAWSIAASGAAEVSQTSGNVFYRVHRGGPFAVKTSLGTIHVTGTCFRIEVVMKNARPLAAGTVAGAVLATAVMITVYEGGVIARGHGGELALAAGEQAVLTPGAGPMLATGIPDSPATLAPPSSSATREQLLLRDEMQRQAIASLRSRVGELEGLAQRPSSASPEGPGDDWFAPSKEELVEMAKNCGLRLDMPPFMRTEPFQFPGGERAEYGLSESERTAVNRVLGELHQAWVARLRGLYVEVTGDTSHVDTLSPQAMAQEIQDKSPEDEEGRVRARISQERAGLLPPPADFSAAPPIERYLRWLVALGDDTEKALGKVLGPERAHELRSHGGGWPMRMDMSGCDEGDGDDKQ